MAAVDPATRNDLREEIDRAITFLIGAPRRLPPPNDEEAERLLCAAARWGYVAEVDPKDFYSDARGVIFTCVRDLRAAGMTRISDDAIVRLAEAYDWSPVRMRDELETIRVEPRAVRLEELAWRVTMAARRRRALDLILRAEAHLRGDGDMDAVVDFLARAADEVSL